MQSSAESVGPEKRQSRIVPRVVFALLVVAAAIVGAFVGLFLVYSTDLPQVSELETYRPSAVTEVYDDQGRTIGSFALQRRVVVQYEDIPKVLRDAILSIEDKDFDKHWGVDFGRVFGAAWRDILSGSRAQGASTLTMQLSRNLFLSPDRTFSRKMQEVMLTIQIERRFTKEQIFTMYANQIFLGHGAYGFEAGANYYFNKRAKDLTLEEAALLAGLPKGPSSYSPLNYPDRALRRRNLVINALLEDGKITAEEAARAKAQPLRLKLGVPSNSLAPYFVEEVRQYLEKKYGSTTVHEGGLKVYTSINQELQAAANAAVLDGLAAYERRHGWKGNLPNVLAAGESLERFHHPAWADPVSVGTYTYALVTRVAGHRADVKLGRYAAVISPEEMKWTGRKTPEEILALGDIIYVKVTQLGPDGVANVSLEQDSGTQAALVAIDNSTGDVKAMVGGRSFAVSKFNRATQAYRQVGSSFKPYVYTAAVDNGATPEDVIVDAPTTFQTPGGPYTPHNYDGKYEGRITLRRAVAQSRNIPALKIADQVGIRTVIDYTRRFGITSEIPAYLPIALGAADMLLLQHTAAFTTFPNDGVRVTPRYIRKVTDQDGRVLEENFAEVHDAIPARTARIMTALLSEVVKHGTAFQASKLKHPLAGKTGTTNDFSDAWFVGFSPSITCGVWVGFDDKSRSLGNKETGGVAALPVWIDFMKVAIQGKENEQFLPPPPPGAAPLQTKLDKPGLAPGDPEAH